MRKRRLGLRIGLAGVLLFASVALVSAGKVPVIAYSAIQNDLLMATTYKLVGGGGNPPVPPREQTIEDFMPMVDTMGTMNYIYGHEFDDATLYPVGSAVKWKVNRYTKTFGVIIVGAELSRGTTTAQ